MSEKIEDLYRTNRTNRTPQPPPCGVLGRILQRFQPAAPELAAQERAGVLPQPVGEIPPDLPTEPIRPVEPSSSWDAARANAIIATTDAIIEGILATPDGFTLTPARRNVLDIHERAVVRRHAGNHDPALWKWPAALHHMLDRWRREDAMPVSSSSTSTEP
jgi:hypothetical protein